MFQPRIHFVFDKLRAPLHVCLVRIQNKNFFFWQFHNFYRKFDLIIFISSMPMHKNVYIHLICLETSFFFSLSSDHVSHPSTRKLYFYKCCYFRYSHSFVYNFLTHTLQGGLDPSWVSSNISSTHLNLDESSSSHGFEFDYITESKLS